jgi:transposase
MTTKIIQSGEIRFKAYAQDIVIDLPVRIQDLVSENVLAQIINELVEGIEMRELERYYSGLGCPPYHPKMMIKVWIYGYCTKVYTSRPLAKKLREDLVFMWLAGGHRPCFKTLSDFRSCRMQDLVDTVLSTVLLYLVEHDYINLDDLYVDGSKWEANANKHKVVWRKNTERYKTGVLNRIASLLEDLKALQQAEDAAYGKKDLVEHQSREQIHVVLNSADLQSQLVHLNELIEQQVDQQSKRSMKKIHRHLCEEQSKLTKYEQQEAVLDHRNSYSKTDEDATALRMKDDRLLPGYNTQITTSDQFIVNATIHQNASDSPTLKPHVEKLEERVEDLVEADWAPDYTADAGYGSEENYDLLGAKGYTCYVKYPLWYQEHTGKLSKRPFVSYNWYFDAEQDYYLCPNQKKLLFKEEVIKTTLNGYDRRLRIYESEGCAQCPLFEACRGPNAMAGSNRKVQRSEKLEAYKEEVRKRLASEEGLTKRSQRSIDVETPFADIKYNMGHRRFVLRGLDKVTVEFQLLVLAHNIRKIYCEQTGIWVEHYAHRAARKAAKGKKRA